MGIRGQRFIILITFLLIGLTQASFSQSYIVGAKGGLSIPDIKGGTTPQSEGYTSRLAANFGVFVNYKINSNFAVIGEVLFSGQGGQRNGMQAIFDESLEGMPIPPGVNIYADFENETIINYLEIPILAQYSLYGDESGFDFYADAGPYIGILLNAKVVTSGFGNIYLDKEGNTPLGLSGFQLPPQSFDNEADIAAKLNDINVGISGGLGVDYKFGRQLVRFDLRGSYGFIPIQADEENGSNNIGAVYITLGYGYSI